LNEIEFETFKFLNSEILLKTFQLLLCRLCLKINLRVSKDVLDLNLIDQKVLLCYFGIESYSERQIVEPSPDIQARAVGVTLIKK
jgi:hypothetical protein